MLPVKFETTKINTEHQGMIKDEALSMYPSILDSINLDGDLGIVMASDKAYKIALDVVLNDLAYDFITKEHKFQTVPSVAGSQRYISIEDSNND